MASWLIKTSMIVHGKKQVDFSLRIFNDEKWLAFEFRSVSKKFIILYITFKKSTICTLLETSKQIIHRLQGLNKKKLPKMLLSSVTNSLIKNSHEYLILIFAR